MHQQPFSRLKSHRSESRERMRKDDAHLSYPSLTVPAAAPSRPRDVYCSTVDAAMRPTARSRAIRSVVPRGPTALGRGTCARDGALGRNRRAVPRRERSRRNESKSESIPPELEGKEEGEIETERREAHLDFGADQTIEIVEDDERGSMPASFVEPILHFPLENGQSLIGQFGAIDVERICATPTRNASCISTRIAMGGGVSTWPSEAGGKGLAHESAPVDGSPIRSKSDASTTICPRPRLP